MDFNQLPHTVCRDIFTFLPIEDVLRFQEACEITRGMETAKAMCSVVLDPVKYLDRSFGRGARLLLAMAMSNVYLSGSRALDYFVPGSADENSDWDFYIAYEPIETYKFMKSMEELGVTWTKNSDLMREVGKTPGKRVRIRLTSKEGRAIEKATRYMDIPDMMHPFTDLPIQMSRVDGSDRTMSPMQSIIIENQVDQIYITVDSEPHYIMEAFEVVYGKYRWKDHKADIQLIVMNMPFLGLYNFLSQFHSSCVQCFIFPAGAAHLYGKQASKGQSYLWLRHLLATPREVMPAPNDSRVLKPTDEFINSFPHWAKYKQRGFEYNFAPVMAVSGGFFGLESGAQQQATVTRIECTSIPKHIMEWYEEMLFKIRWDETTKRLDFKESRWCLHYYPDWFDDVPREVVVKYFEDKVGKLLIDLISNPSSFIRNHDPRNFGAS